MFAILTLLAFVLTLALGTGLWTSEVAAQQRYSATQSRSDLADHGRSPRREFRRNSNQSRGRERSYQQPQLQPSGRADELLRNRPAQTNQRPILDEFAVRNQRGETPILDALQLLAGQQGRSDTPILSALIGDRVNRGSAADLIFRNRESKNQRKTEETYVKAYRDVAIAETVAGVLGAVIEQRYARPQVYVESREYSQPSRNYVEPPRYSRPPTVQPQAYDHRPVCPECRGEVVPRRYWRRH